MKVKIGDRWLGPDEPIFLSIETGTTCNGDLETALRMVDKAKEAGADAIKFMIIGPEYFMSDTSVTYEYEWAGGKRTENMFEMFKGLTFTSDEWKQIRDRCKQVGIIFFATVDYLPGVDLAEELGTEAYKLSSWDTTNFPLVRAMARTGKPIVIDAGPTTSTDLAKLVDVIHEEGNDQIVLVHCSHADKDAQVNLRSIPYMESAYNTCVGYSADNQDTVPDLLAVALGAQYIEKRLTLERGFKGHHHIKALEPEELANWTKMVRRAEEMMGRWGVFPSDEDTRMRDLYFTSVVANMDIAKGTVLTDEMLICKRPGTGIAPELCGLLVGRTAQVDIKHNQIIGWEMV